MTTLQNPVVVQPTAKHTATVIWLHGLGDSGLGWLFLAEALAAHFPYIKWVFPNAPLRAIAANDNVTMPAWFNILGFAKDANEKNNVDEAGMLESVEMVNQLILKESETDGIPTDRILLGGFSQGCVIALLTGWSSKIKLAGVIGCSGWLALDRRLFKIASDTNKQTPFLVCHGQEDAVVKHSYGQASARFLNKVGYNATFKSYPDLGHASIPREIADIAEFIKQHLPPELKSNL